MHLLSFRIDEERSFGALVEGKIVDLGKHLPEFGSLRELLAGGGLVRALDTVAEVSAQYRSDRITWLPPLRRPDHLYCVFDDPTSDSVIVEPPTVVGHRRALPCPSGDATLWVGVAIVVGPRERAADASQIAGITLVTYLVPGGAAMGPTMVTMDEVAGLAGLELTFSCGEFETVVTLPDLEKVFSQAAAQHELDVGDLVALLHQIPGVDLTEAEKVRVRSEVVGSLTNPLVGISD